MDFFFLIYLLTVLGYIQHLLFVCDNDSKVTIVAEEYENKYLYRFTMTHSKTVIFKYTFSLIRF